MGSWEKGHKWENWWNSNEVCRLALIACQGLFPVFFYGCAMVMEDVNIRGSWIKCVQELSCIFSLRLKLFHNNKTKNNGVFPSNFQSQQSFFSPIVSFELKNLNMFDLFQSITVKIVPYLARGDRIRLDPEFFWLRLPESSWLQ